MRASSPGSERVTGTPALAAGYAVVIPMYNESRNAERCVRRVSEVIAETHPTGFLIAVDDGSQDDTAAILDRLTRDIPTLVVVHRPQNGGYGAALVTGVKEAIRRGAGYVLFMDSDLTNDPKYIPAFVERMRDDVDVIKATRYAGGGGVRGVPLWRVLISRIGNKLCRRLFQLPVTDATNGFRAVKTRLVAQVPYQESGFAIILEELFQLSRTARTYAEIPYILTSRGEGERVSSFAYRPDVLRRYLKYAMLASRDARRQGQSRSDNE